MQVHDIWGVAGALCLIGMVTTLVGHSGTATDVTAVGNAFNGALKESEGTAS